MTIQQALVDAKLAECPKLVFTCNKCGNTWETKSHMPGTRRVNSCREYDEDKKR